MLAGRNLGARDRRHHVIHMILVTKQTVLTRHVAAVARLAAILFHRTEFGCEIMRIVLLIALQIRASFFKVMASQTTVISDDAEMRLVDETREASPCHCDGERREIDDPSFALEVVDAVALRA